MNCFIDNISKISRRYCNPSANQGFCHLGLSIRLLQMSLKPGTPNGVKKQTLVSPRSMNSIWTSKVNRVLALRGWLAESCHICWDAIRPCAALREVSRKLNPISWPVKEAGVFPLHCTMSLFPWSGQESSSSCRLACSTVSLPGPVDTKATVLVTCSMNLL